MKKVAYAAFRFFSMFVASSLTLTVVLTVGFILDNGFEALGRTLYDVSVSMVPVSVMASVFFSFFLMNRLFASRIRGYLLVIVLASLALVGPAMLARYLYPLSEPVSAALPASIRPIGAWMRDIAGADWLELVPGLLSYAAFVSAFWGCTRLSRSRPLLGAFIAPSAALAALRLFALYLSGPADALFSLAGLTVTRPLSAAILTAASALALFLLDALIARKPAGGRLDA